MILCDRLGAKYYLDSMRFFTIQDANGLPIDKG